MLEKQSGGVVVSVGRAAETSIAADGWFAVLALVAGFAAAGLGAALLPESRLGTLLGLALGGLVGSAAAWRLGEALGPPSVAESSAALPPGARFDGPLDLSALGVLLAWPMASVIAFFAVVAGVESSRPEHAAADHDEPGVTQGGGPERSSPR